MIRCFPTTLVATGCVSYPNLDGPRLHKARALGLDRPRWAEVKTVSDSFSDTVGTIEVTKTAGIGVASDRAEASSAVETEVQVPARTSQPHVVSTVQATVVIQHQSGR